MSIEKFSIKLNPLIDSTIVLSKKITQITDETESLLKITGLIVGDIIDRLTTILKIESKVRNGIAEAVLPIVSIIKALRNGVRTFSKSFRSTKLIISSDITQKH